MNQHSDMDRVLQAWMADGPAAIPDRVVDVVAARIGVQRQRRTWPFHRRTNVTPIKLIAALAAVVVVAVIGFNLLPRQPSFAGSAPTASPSASPTANPSAAPVTVPEGPLTRGRYAFHPSTDDPNLAVAADIPAGWTGHRPWAASGPNGTGAPTGIAVAFLVVDGLHSDPCHWDRAGTGAYNQPGDVEIGPDVIDLVDAIRNNSSYTSTTPSQVSFGPYQGYEMEIQIPADLSLTEDCDPDFGGSDGRYFVFSGTDAGLYAQGEGNLWHVFIIDVDGTRVVVVGSYYAGTPTTDQEAFRSIIESMEFMP